jgi:glucose uptake protein
MVIIQSYPVAVVLLFITMVCWGSWANTQKLATKEWPFQLFYWDYALGVLVLALAFALTLGSIGTAGRSFFVDLGQANGGALGSAFLGGVVFNLANLLLVVAIEIAGMAVAFPIGIGLALVIGVVVNYLATPLGDPVILFTGVALVTTAIVLDALAYRRLPSESGTATLRGLGISVLAGILMGFFYRFVAASMSLDFISPTPGKLTPYTAMFVFAIGLLLSNFVWNGYFMRRPVSGEPVTYREYLERGTPRLHVIGLLGGVIWSIGMSFSIIASNKAGFAISYGLGQGAPMVAAFWGVFVWDEFEEAPDGTNTLIGLMFATFIVGLLTIIYARVA